MEFVAEVQVYVVLGNDLVFDHVGQHSVHCPPGFPTGLAVRISVTWHDMVGVAYGSTTPAPYT